MAGLRRWRSLQGIPSLEEQERRDRVPAGAYRTLEHVGRLTVDVGLRVQSTAALCGQLYVEQWGIFRPWSYAIGSASVNCWTWSRTWCRSSHV